MTQAKKDLVWALQNLGPLLIEADNPNASEREHINQNRTQAAQMLYDAMTHIAENRLRSFPEKDREDAIQDQLYILIEPRTSKQWSFQNEKQASSFLYTCLRHKLIENQRKIKPTLQADYSQEDFPPEELAIGMVGSHPHMQPDAMLDEQQMSALIQQAEQQMFEVLLPQIAATMRSDAAAHFQQILGELRAIRDGTLKLEDLIEQEARGKEEFEPSQEKRHKVRNRYYKRCERALTNLAENLLKMWREAVCSEEEWFALAILYDQLPLRKRPALYEELKKELRS